MTKDPKIIIRVSFEITDNWQLGDFRSVIKVLQTNPSEYNPLVQEFEMFIISNTTDTVYYSAVAANANIDVNHRFQVMGVDAKLQSIRDNKIDIHLDNLNPTVTRVENETDAWGILVDSKRDYYNVEPLYSRYIRDRVWAILRERGIIDNDGKAC